jgi:hypothetical protein
MSKYLTFPDIVFKDRRLLLAALAELGYTWRGKRKARRERARARRHTVGGSGAWTRRPLARSRAA